jgi:hypothetical protein
MDCCHFAEMDGVCTQASCAVLWAAMRLLDEKIGMCRTRVSAPSVRSGLRVDIDDSAPLTDGSVPPVDISLPRSRSQALDLRTEALSFVARR